MYVHLGWKTLESYSFLLLVFHGSGEIFVDSGAGNGFQHYLFCIASRFTGMKKQSMLSIVKNIISPDEAN